MIEKKTDCMVISPGHRGRSDYTPLSMPVSYGIRDKVKFKGFGLEFDMNGAIKYIYGLDPERWPDPTARLKLTLANEWIYLDPSGYDDVFALTGRYYLPRSRKWDRLLFSDDIFNSSFILDALACWRELVAICKTGPVKFSDEDNAIGNLVRRIGNYDGPALSRRSDRLHRIIRGTVPILPPDCVNVEYEVIPLIVSEGCLYNCSFCCLKTGVDFSPRPIDDVKRQLTELKSFFSADLLNYNSIFLGQNDALAADRELVLNAAHLAYEELEIEDSYLRGSNLFMFASPDSFLATEGKFWESLDRLPFSHCYINVGLESFDQTTLDMLGKPVDAATVEEAFFKAEDLNRRSGGLSVSLNFVVGENLPQAHMDKLDDFLSKRSRPVLKGAVYISPLSGWIKDFRDLKRKIFQLKSRSRWPLFLYLFHSL